MSGFNGAQHAFSPTHLAAGPGQPESIDMIQYHYQQAAAHAQRNPGDATAAAQMQYWQTRLANAQAAAQGQMFIPANLLAGSGPQAPTPPTTAPNPVFQIPQAWNSYHHLLANTS